MKDILFKLLLATVLVFAPVQSTLLVVMLMTVLDLISGLISAIKRGERITSSGFKRTIAKVMVYETVVILGFLVETYLTGDVVPLVKILAGYIGITELTSVMENLQAITGFDILKTLISKITPPNQ